MDTKTSLSAFIAASFWVAIFAVIIGCSGKKEDAAAKVDPHSAEGVNQEFQFQQTLLSNALQRQEFTLIHRQMFYLELMADTLNRRLEGDPRKERVAPLLVELKQLTQQIDRSGGSKHQEATATMLAKLFDVFKRIDAEISPPANKE